MGMDEIGALFRQNADSIVSGARNAFFWSHFYAKMPSFYQDRLGTNRGNVEKKGVFRLLGWWELHNELASTQVL